MANESFTSFTVHYIDNEWRLRSYVAGCDHFPGTKTTEDIILQLEQMSTGIGKSGTDLVALLTDNEPTNKLLGKKLHERNICEWMGCFDHILNLITEVSFDHESVKQLIMRARTLVGSVTGSSQLQAKLMQSQKLMDPTRTPLNIIQDQTAQHRWWATYNMTSRLIE